MSLKRTIAKIALVSMLLITFIIFMGAANPYAGKSAYVEQHWFDIIIEADSYQLALLEHAIDMGGVPLPEYLDDLELAGYTISSTTRIGYTFLMENNRRWPFGGWDTIDPTYGKIGDGSPEEDHAGNATYFRKGLHRLIDMDHYVDTLYAPLNSKCDYYLPPGAAYWINPACPAPPYNPGTAGDAFPLETASAYLNEGGFTAGSDANTYADADTEASWYSSTLRIDPTTGDTMEEFEYYAIGPVESPIGFEMATQITAVLHTAGVPCNLVAGTWLGMVIRLVNTIWEDYQMMTGVGITWGTPAPDILYDFTYSENLPLWNFAVQNSSVADAAGLRMMTTLDLAECRQAAFDIQTYLYENEPYRPMLLWEMFVASTGPYEDEPGMIGIVNFAGRGAHTSSNYWGKMLSRAGRVDTDSGMDINKWGLGSYLDTLNPLTADTVPDWQCMTNLFTGFYTRNPYTLEYMWWACEDMPDIEPWIGPGGSWIYETDMGGCAATYDAPFNGTHYNGIPVAEPGAYNVTSSDLVGDDQLGMVTTWKLRPDIFWHDSNSTNPRPLTNADVEWGFNLLRYQENMRYMTQWTFVYAIEPLADGLTFKLYEERRFLFSFEGHDVSILAPKHIWEDYIGTGQINDDALTLTRPDGTTGKADCWDYYSVDDTGYNNHHDDWSGWEEIYMEDPNRPGWDLTYLIGHGPWVYHYGGWEEGHSVRFERSSTSYAGHICAADIDFNKKCEPATEDVNKLLRSTGVYGAPNYDISCDTVWPAQIVWEPERSYFLDHSGHYWGPDPVPSGFVRCPESNVP
jgi:hypothetical protein